MTCEALLYRSTLRTPWGTRSAVVGPVSVPESAHPTDRPPLAREHAVSFFHGHCHFGGPSPSTSSASFEEDDPCPGFMSVPTTQIPKDPRLVRTHCSGVCTLHPAPRHSSRRSCLLAVGLDHSPVARLPWPSSSTSRFRSGWRFVDASGLTLGDRDPLFRFIPL